MEAPQIPEHYQIVEAKANGDVIIPASKESETVAAMGKGTTHSFRPLNDFIMPTSFNYDTPKTHPKPSLDPNPCPRKPAMNGTAQKRSTYNGGRSSSSSDSDTHKRPYHSKPRGPSTASTSNKQSSSNGSSGSGNGSNGGRVYECQDCHKVFSRQHDLKRHQALHTGIKPYKCNICDRAFARLDALNRHRKASSGCSGLNAKNHHGRLYQVTKRQEQKSGAPANNKQYTSENHSSGIDVDLDKESRKEKNGGSSGSGSGSGNGNASNKGNRSSNGDGSNGSGNGSNGSGSNGRDGQSAGTSSAASQISGNGFLASAESSGSSANNQNRNWHQHHHNHVHHHTQSIEEETSQSRGPMKGTEEGHEHHWEKPKPLKLQPIQVPSPPNSARNVTYSTETAPHPIHAQMWMHPSPDPTISASSARSPEASRSHPRRSHPRKHSHNFFPRNKHMHLNFTEQRKDIGNSSNSSALNPNHSTSSDSYPVDNDHFTPSKLPTTTRQRPPFEAPGYSPRPPDHGKGVNVRPIVSQATPFGTPMSFGVGRPPIRNPTVWRPQASVPMQGINGTRKLDGAGDTANYNASLMNLVQERPRSPGSMSVDGRSDHGPKAISVQEAIASNPTSSQQVGPDGTPVNMTALPIGSRSDSGTGTFSIVGNDGALRASGLNLLSLTANWQPIPASQPDTRLPDRASVPEKLDSANVLEDPPSFLSNGKTQHRYHHHKHQHQHQHQHHHYRSGVQETPATGSSTNGIYSSEDFQLSASALGLGPLQKDSGGNWASPFERLMNRAALSVPQMPVHDPGGKELVANGSAPSTAPPSQRASKPGQPHTSSNTPQLRETRAQQDQRAHGTDDESAPSTNPKFSPLQNNVIARWLSDNGPDEEMFVQDTSGSYTAAETGELARSVIQSLKAELRQEKQLREDYQRRVEQLTLQNLKLDIEKSLLKSMIMDKQNANLPSQCATLPAESSHGLSPLSSSDRFSLPIPPYFPVRPSNSPKLQNIASPGSSETIDRVA